MSRSLLHDWEGSIERNKNNTEELLNIAEDIYNTAYTRGKASTKRPQGECRTCIHRDPEDKKCDCGAQERIGCSWPVSDDYYCKYYERGEEE